MSNYIDKVNKIKTNFSFEWLFPSQKIIYDQVLKFCPPHRMVNIFGREGVGKTFIGWVLEKQGYGVYFTSLDTITEGVNVAIIDNVDSSKKSIRAIRNDIHFANINYAILITQRKADDAIPCFQLELFDDDIHVFKGNLFRYLDLTCCDGNFYNLWKYFYLPTDK